MPASIPAAYTTRPLTTDDAEALFGLIVDQEMHDLGEEVTELADIVADWQRPDHDLATQSLGVFDGEVLVAWAEHTGNGRCEAAVRPAYRRQGIGTALASWLEDLGRAQGLSVIGSPVPQGSPGDHLLESLGYFTRWTSWVLAMPPGEQVQRRELPAGYRLGEVPESEIPAVHDVLETAFADWANRERESFETFEATITRRPGFEPWQLRGVWAPDDTLVACAIVQWAPPAEAFVARLGTLHAHRNRGLAQAVLADAFDAGRVRGATKFSLSTDSRTGALGLYEKVGMVVTSQWVNRARTL